MKLLSSRDTNITKDMLMGILDRILEQNITIVSQLGPREDVTGGHGSATKLLGRSQTTTNMPGILQHLVQQGWHLPTVRVVPEAGLTRATLQGRSVVFTSEHNAC